MKKIYTFCVIMLFAVFSIGAQIVQNKSAEKKGTVKVQNTINAKHAKPVSSTVIWSDDFSVASNWVISHAPGTTGDWIISSAAPNGPNAISVINTNGDFAKFDSDSICSYDQIANLTNANRIDLTGHSSVRLTFSQYYDRYYDSTYIYVSNDSVNWTKFEVNGNLIALQYSANDPLINPDIVNVDISSVAGNQDSVYVRFQFYSPDTNLAGADTSAGCGFAWMIDDVSISDIPTLDASIDNIFAGEYCNIPIIQPEAFLLRGKLINRGSSVIINGAIIFNVYDQNGFLFRDTSSVVPTLAVGDTSNVLTSLHPFVPTVTGFYLVEQLVFVPGDGNSVNDTNLVNIYVSDSTMARDLTAIGGNTYLYPFGYNGSTGSIGEIFHVYNASSFSSATISLKQPNVGSDVSVSVYSVNGGNPDTLMGSSDVYTLTNADTLALTLQFVPWVDVTAGDYFVCVNQLDTNFLSIGVSSEIYTPHKGFFKNGAAVSWTTFEAANYNWTAMIRVNNPSGTLLSSGKVPAVETPFNVFPNPSAGVIYVAGKGLEKNVTVTVFNQLGQIVKTAHFDQLTISRIDLHSFSEGMYTVNIRSSSGETNKIIILE